MLKFPLIIPPRGTIYRDTAELIAQRVPTTLAVIGASPGGFGTLSSQHHWLPVLRALGTRHWSGGRLLVSRAGTVFGADGRLQDEGLRRQLTDFVLGFAAFVAADARGRQPVA